MREHLPLQPGDMPETCADVADLEAAVGFRPQPPLAEGVRRFVEWYRGYIADRGACGKQGPRLRRTG